MTKLACLSSLLTEPIESNVTMLDVLTCGLFHSITTENEMMKIWILRPILTSGVQDTPWEGVYDMNFGFIIRAETEEQARIAAQSNASDEAYSFSSREVINCWMNPIQSTCIELSYDGPMEIIMRDFHAG